MLKAQERERVREKAGFNIDSVLLERLRDHTARHRMNQSDAVEWGIQCWLETFAGEAPPRGRPVYCERGYETMLLLAEMFNNPKDETQVAFLKSLEKLVPAITE